MHVIKNQTRDKNHKNFYVKELKFLKDQIFLAENMKNFNSLIICY